MKHAKGGCDQKCMMCRYCMKEWLPAIQSNVEHLSFKKGEEIFSEGDVVKGMYFVYEGVVKVHKRWAGDKELIIRLAGKGDILGHRGLGADEIYPISGTALEPVTVCYLNMDFFNATLKVNNGFLYELMMFFAAELKVSERKMRNLAHMPVKGRLAQTLLNLVEKFGMEASGLIKFSLSRQDLASFAGTTYETVFRTMQELVEEKLVRLEGKDIFLLNPDGLKTYITQD